MARRRRTRACARARACLRSQAGIRPALPSSFFTMSNSPLRGVCRTANLVPPAHCLRPSCSVVVLCLHRISAALAGASAWLAPQILGVSSSSGPEIRGPAERREASCRVSQSRSVRRDLTFAVGRPAQAGHATSRCSTVALSPRNRSGPGSGREAARGRPLLMAGYGPGLAVTALRAAIDATPRSACWIVYEDAPHERG